MGKRPKGKAIGKAIYDGEKKLQIRKFKGKGSKANLYFVQQPKKN